MKQFKMKWFKNPGTCEELRRQYLRLIKENHPDNGGNVEAVQEINAEYETLFKILRYIHEDAKESGTAETKKTDWAYTDEIDKTLRDAIEKIIHLDGIQIEICGCWIWVSGETFPVKDALKAAGFRWCRDKKMWAFHSGTYHKKSKKKNSMDDIRNMYGSHPVASRPVAALN